MNDVNYKLNQPNYYELLFLILTGVFHIIVELTWGGTKEESFNFGSIEYLYNASAVMLWSIYLIWRMKKMKGILKLWGFRSDNFISAMRPCSIFAILAMIILFIYGWVAGYLPMPSSFWIILILYPIWGIAQQFALQVLIGRNLQYIIKSLPIRVIIIASLFSASHFPNFCLMALGFPLGIATTIIYNRHPNLWAIGIIHGILGALAYYLVLGQDPTTEILKLIF